MYRLAGFLENRYLAEACGFVESMRSILLFKYTYVGAENLSVLCVAIVDA
jgi:hypothetical protein